MSGGKDSTALALYMRDRVKDMEYVFCDTDKELTETYEYLNRVEAFLGKKIVRLNAKAGFDHWLDVFGGYLPSPQMRWCTKLLKLKPFEEYVGDEPVVSYVGLRADEDRVARSPLVRPRPARGIHLENPHRYRGRPASSGRLGSRAARVACAERHRVWVRTLGEERWSYLQVEGSLRVGFEKTRLLSCEADTHAGAAAGR
jgi:hypothetical protein